MWGGEIRQHSLIFYYMAYNSCTIGAALSWGWSWYPPSLEVVRLVAAGLCDRVSGGPDGFFYTQDLGPLWWYGLSVSQKPWLKGEASTAPARITQGRDFPGLPVHVGRCCFVNPSLLSLPPRAPFPSERVFPSPSLNQADVSPFPPLTQPWWVPADQSFHVLSAIHCFGY